RLITHRLLGPQPLVMLNASPATESTLGIHQWRLYKGATDYVLTGYDANHQPVQGFSIAFVGERNGAAPSIKLRAHDGLGFSANYDFRQATINGQLSEKSDAFMM